MHLKKCNFMNMWSRSTYKRLRKRSNSFPVHKKLVWPTDLPKSEEEIFNSSQPRGVCSGFQLCVAIDPDLSFKAKCALYYLLEDQRFYQNFVRMVSIWYCFQNYLNKKCTNDIFIIIFVCFWSVIYVNWRVMTLVDVKLSHASVSLCNWVLKLGLVLWSFMAISISKREAIKAFNERSSFVWAVGCFVILK